MFRRLLGDSRGAAGSHRCPTPVDGLSAALNATPGARAEFLNLALVETTLLCVTGATLASVPAVILKRAAHEIQLLPSFNTRADLQLLELQMLSQTLVNEARFEEDNPIPAPKFSFFGRRAGDEWADTRPMLRS